MASYSIIFVVELTPNTVCCCLQFLARSNSVFWKTLTLKTRSLDWSVCWFVGYLVICLTSSWNCCLSMQSFTFGMHAWCRCSCRCCVERQKQFVFIAVLSQKSLLISNQNTNFIVVDICGSLLLMLLWSKLESEN